jgi:hypothetical protein
MKKSTLCICLFPITLFSQNAVSIDPVKVTIQDNVERYLFDYTRSDDLGLNEMHAPVGWAEPIIEAEFVIRGIVMSGSLGLQFKDSTVIITENRGFYIPRGKRVRIFNSGEEELVLIEVLTPAYKPQSVRQFDQFD